MEECKEKFKKTKPTKQPNQNKKKAPYKQKSKQQIGRTIFTAFWKH